MFLGENLLPLLILALGGAMVVGNGLAIVRPPGARADGDLARAPLWRSGAMIAVGLVGTVWAIATLLS